MKRQKKEVRRAYSCLNCEYCVVDEDTGTLFCQIDNSEVFASNVCNLFKTVSKAVSNVH